MGCNGAGRRGIPGRAGRAGPISPGNSGGAVVNARGQLVGISEAYIPPEAGAVSLGFAIPSPAEDLLAVLRKHDPGDVVTVEIRRGSDTSQVKVTLSDRPTG